MHYSLSMSNALPTTLSTPPNTRHGYSDIGELVVLWNDSSDLGPRGGQRYAVRTMTQAKLRDQTRLQRSKTWDSCCTFKTHADALAYFRSKVLG